MGDYEGVPTQFEWLPDATEGEVDAYASDGWRLTGIHRRDGGADARYSAAAVAEPGVQAGWVPNMKAQTLFNNVRTNAARLTCVDAFSDDGRLRFTGGYVSNEGPGSHWWDFRWDLTADGLWFIGATGLEVNRIVSLTTYVKDGARLYAAVLYPGDPHYELWNYGASLSWEELAQQLATDEGRLISIDPFLENGQTRFAAVWVKPGQEYAKRWYYGSGQDGMTVGIQAADYCSHVVEARSLPGQPDAFVHIRHGLPRAPYKDSARLVELKGSATFGGWSYRRQDFGQQNDVSLEITNVSGRDVRLVECEWRQTYDGWYFPDQPGERLLFAPGETLPANQGRSNTYVRPDAGVTHVIARVRAVAGDETQRAAIVLPVQGASGAAVPAPHEGRVPVDIGLWANPLHVVPLWVDGSRRKLLMIPGIVHNWSGERVRVAGFVATVRGPSGELLAESPIQDMRGWGTGAPPTEHTIPGSFAEIPSPRGARFIHQIDLTHVPDTSSLSVRLAFDYKLMSNRWCDGFVREVQAGDLRPQPAVPPVRGDWIWGNTWPRVGPEGARFDTHAHYFEQYCYDLGAVKRSGGEWIEREGPEDRNDSYLCYGQPVHAMLDGEVVTASYANTRENSGNKQDALDAPSNFVALAHEAGALSPSMSTYHHLRPQAPPGGLTAGQRVSAGDVIGYVGNSGASSAPHLHLWFWSVNASGRPSPHACDFPGRMKAIETNDLPVDGVPGVGRYNSW